VGYRLARKRARIHKRVGLAAFVDGLSQKFANVTLTGPDDERKAFVRQLQNGRRTSNGQGPGPESFPDRERYIAEALSGNSASTAARPSSLVKARRGRPENQDRPHISLYHDVFARFRAKIMDTSLEIPTTVYAEVIELFGKAQAV
jgi:hypothetical protein